MSFLVAFCYRSWISKSQPVLQITVTDEKSWALHSRQMAEVELYSSQYVKSDQEREVAGWVEARAWVESRVGRCYGTSCLLALTDCCKEGSPSSGLCSSMTSLRTFKALLPLSDNLTLKVFVCDIIFHFMMLR